MKTLKFKPHLCDMILAGTKTTTWRLFDDKDLQNGDLLVLRNVETGEDVAEAKITSCTEKQLGGVTDEDYEGHERYESTEAMIEHFRGYYGDKVDAYSPLKIIKFELLKKFAAA